MFCSGCGKQIDDDAAFCPACGEQIAPKTSGFRPSRRWIWTTALVAVAAIAVVAVVLSAQKTAPTHQTGQANETEAGYLHLVLEGGSMESTLSVGAHLLVNANAYMSHAPQRGDIIVFNGAGTNFPNEAEGPSEFVKRVIAVGGDTIQCCTDGHVVVNGRLLNETYVYQDNELPFCLSTIAGSSSTVPASGPACNALTAQPFLVPKGTLFVMGDHRDDSADSRYEGVIPDASVIGQVVNP